MSVGVTGLLNSGRQETTIYRWVIQSVTFLAQAAVGAPPAIFVLAVFFQVDLHLNKTQLGLLSSAFGFGIMTSLLISGWITDICRAVSVAARLRYRRASDY